MTDNIYHIRDASYRMGLLETGCFLSTKTHEHWIIKGNRLVYQRLISGYTGDL